MEIVRWWMVWGLTAMVLWVWPCLAQAHVVELDRATAEITIQGKPSVLDVRLPYGWDYHHKGLSGTGRFEMVFDGPPDTNMPWALYFSRLGNGYRIKLNGTVLEHNGALYPADATTDGVHHVNGAKDSGDFGDYSKLPRFVQIPATLLLPRNHLEVTIRSDGGRRSGVPSVWVGPKDELEPVYRQKFAVRMGGTAALTAFSLIVGVFAAVLWLTQTDPRPEHRGVRDRLYLFAAVAECAWALFLTDTLIERPPLEWPWWATTMNMALGVWLSAILMFCHTIAGWENHRASRWIQRCLAVLLLLGPGIAFTAYSTPMPGLATLWQGVFAVVFIASTMLFLAQATRQASGMHKTVAVAFLLNVPVGLHDFYIARMGDAFANEAYLRYSATLFGLALAVIAIDRFRTANLRVRDMIDSLAVRIDNKQKELSHSYQRMELIAREQERVLERSRILRDMHDGVGSHISSAIRQLQSGQANRDEVLMTLQDSLDQLKLSIDALNLPPGDVTALLANLRYRLEPRFRAMGLALEWAVTHLPDYPSLDAGAMRQLQYIFFEAFSNVMQHARASVLRIEATATARENGGQGIHIRISDNGCGFDTTTVHRTGLLSMQDRANAMGAQLRVRSQAGETCIELQLV